MNIRTSHPLIEEILGTWQTRIGAAWPGYRGHVYRMFNFCLALRECTAEEEQKLAIAACFHDIGLWSANTLDYLPPSVAEAEKYLAHAGLHDWMEEVGLMIALHHKLRAVDDARYPLVEVFRQADLIDFSLGLVTFGLPWSYVRMVKAAIPNNGFHRFLMKAGSEWAVRHPRNPLPFIRW